MKRLILGLGALILLLGGVGRARADYIQIPAYGPPIGYWGPPMPLSLYGLSFGEVFTVPLGNSLLNDYTLTTESVGGTFLFVSQVYAWDNGPIGQALFTSNVNTTTGAETPYMFAPNIAVNSGQQYIALLTAEPHGIVLGGTGYGIMPQANPYPGAGSVATYGNPDIAGNWGGVGPYSLQFTADFSSTSEPANLAPLLAIAGLAWYGWRRRKLAAA
jgi:hypothetical protein